MSMLDSKNWYWVYIFLMFCFWCIAAVAWLIRTTLNWPNCMLNTRTKVCSKDPSVPLLSCFNSSFLLFHQFILSSFSSKFIFIIYACVLFIGFEILAFPCNQFGSQEPGTNEEIVQFACTRFKAEYPIFNKVNKIYDIDLTPSKFYWDYSLTRLTQGMWDLISVVEENEAFLIRGCGNLSWADMF